MRRAATAVTVVTTVGLAAASAALAVLVATGWFPLLRTDLASDVAVHRWMLAHPGAVDAAVVVTTLGSPLVVDIVTVALAVGLWLGHRRWAAVAVVVVRLVELGLETVLKWVVARPRPLLDHPLASAAGASFPSGHAAGSAAVLGIVALLLCSGVRVGPARGTRATLRIVAATLGLLLAAAVAVSRVALGVHFPSDVVGGLLLGLACAVAGGLLLPRSDAHDVPELARRGSA